MAMEIVDDRTWCLELAKAYEENQHSLIRENTVVVWLQVAALTKSKSRSTEAISTARRTPSPDDPDDCCCILTDWKGNEVMRVMYDDVDLYLAPSTMSINAWFR